MEFREFDLVAGGKFEYGLLDRVIDTILKLLRQTAVSDAYSVSRSTGVNLRTCKIVNNCHYLIREYNR